MPFYLDTTEFDRACRDIASLSTRTDDEQIRLNGAALARALIYNAPYAKGALASGWGPAQALVGLRIGRANRPQGPLKLKRRVYAVVEGRGELRTGGSPGAERSWTGINTTHAYRKGKKRYYGYIQNASGKHAGWLQRGANEAARKMENLYIKLLRRHSAA